MSLEHDEWKKEQQRLQEERRKTADDFYRKTGRIQDGMSDKQIEEVHAENNYNRDVEVVTLRKGDVVARHQHEHGTNYQAGKDHPNGQFFSDPGAREDQLGLKGDYNQSPRKVDYYVVEEDTEVLKTTAHDVEWNQNTPGKGTGELHHGGETQYYAAEKDLKNFNRVASEKRLDKGPANEESKAPEEQKTKDAAKKEILERQKEEQKRAEDIQQHKERLEENHHRDVKERQLAETRQQHRRSEYEQARLQQAEQEKAHHQAAEAATRQQKQSEQHKTAQRQKQK